MAITRVVLLLFAAIVTLLLLATPLILYRLSIILDPKRSKPLRHGRRNHNEPTHLLIVLGSGGHTAEMIAMLERAVADPDPKRKLQWKEYMHRTWVVGSGDSISAQRAKEFEEMAQGLPDDLSAGKVKKATDLGPGKYDIVTVPRARNIHQSLYTSPLTSYACFRSCWHALTRYTTETRDGHLGQSGEIDFPDLILCNGPATATILVFTSVVLRFFNIKQCSTRHKMRTIYVESWARVKKPSLSGQLLKRVVDRFLVQWPQLEKAAGGRAEYLSVLV